MQTELNKSGAEEDEQLPFGVYGVEYFHGRKKSRQLIYRLGRRSDEVETALKCFCETDAPWVLDVGTADGLMLEELRRRLPKAWFFGMDLSLQLLRANQSSGTPKLQADALRLPVRSASVDAIICTAVIEHVPDANALMEECRRVLRPNGVLALTTPDPIMEKIASAIGLLKEPGHQKTFNLKELKQLATSNGLRPLVAKKFMFSPIGFPGEKVIEKILGPVGLKFVMANQLLIAKRQGG